MQYWEGQYYFSFRNAPEHSELPDMLANALIIRSSDLESGELCARFEMEGMDSTMWYTQGSRTFCGCTEVKLESNPT